MGWLSRLSRRLRFLGASKLCSGRLSGLPLDAIRLGEVPRGKSYLDLLGDGKLFAPWPLEQLVGVRVTDKRLSG
jgi:hypothetical protein